jgi:hypothetical protein
MSGSVTTASRCCEARNSIALSMRPRPLVSTLKQHSDLRSQILAATPSFYPRSLLPLVRLLRAWEIEAKYPTPILHAIEWDTN